MGSGIEHETSGEGELCGPGWLHHYADPILAVLMNPIHGRYDHEMMLMWECEASGRHRNDNGLKGGSTKLKTVRQIGVPKVTAEQRVRFAIFCAQEVVGDKCPAWSEWAEKWLSGEDRTGGAARAARAAAQAAEWAEWAAAAAAAARAVRAATEAAGGVDIVAIAHRAVKGGE